MKYFQNINTLDELRTAYRALLKKFHPDNGGSEEATKEINLEYEKLFQNYPFKKRISGPSEGSQGI